MKRKAFSFILVILMFPVLLGCQGERIPAGNSNPNAEYGLINLGTFEEYSAYISSASLPVDFVSYEKIQDLGRFAGLVILSSATNDEYMYVLENEHLEFALYVYHKPYESPVTSDVIQTLNTKNENDIRTLATEIKGVYSYEGIRYYYASGQLFSIKWESDGHIFSLSDTGLTNYPTDASDFISQLLDLNTAKKCVNTFLQELED